jgi:hypothetical protein
VRTGYTTDHDIQYVITGRKLPKIWKVANIVALFKKGDKSEAGNYRPVSLISVVCKFMEKLVRKQIVDHMTRNRLSSKQHFGFIKGQSTTLQLIKVMDERTEILDCGGKIYSISMDFYEGF